MHCASYQADLFAFCLRQEAILLRLLVLAFVAHKASEDLPGEIRNDKSLYATRGPSAVLLFAHDWGGHPWTQLQHSAHGCARDSHPAKAELVGHGVITAREFRPVH